MKELIKELDHSRIDFFGEKRAQDGFEFVWGIRNFDRVVEVADDAFGEQRGFDLARSAGRRSRAAEQSEGD